MQKIWKAGSLQSLELEFDRMTSLGMAAGRPPWSGGRAALAWGALPGERARVAPIGRQKGALLCRIEEILVPSSERIPPCESHYLSCSPWQVMAYPAQVRWKRRILQELFPGVALERFEEAETAWGYRNKLEFSFTQADGRLQLAFHERATPFRKVALPEGCQLGSAAMNRASLELVERLAERGIDAGVLKSLVVRGSRTTGEVLLALYVMDEQFATHDLELERSAGLAVAYSDPLSPASVTTRMLSRRGHQELTERVGGLELVYSLDSFFQNHAAVFELAIEEIRRHVPETKRLVELYCGVGSIGLALVDRAEEIIGVEVNATAVQYAERNRQRIGASNYEPQAARVEALGNEILAGADVVVLDPPRAGLPPRLVGTLLQARPHRIIYLSCNPANQARDVAQLGSTYHPVTLVGFDFYPQTPHIESLVVLDRREG